MNLNIEDSMPFGKYKNIPIRVMLSFEHFCEFIPYLNWAINNWNNIEFSQEIKDSVDKQTKKEEKYISKLQSKYSFEMAKYYEKHPENKPSKHYKGDYGQSSCPGDYMGMGPEDFGISIW